MFRLDKGATEVYLQVATSRKFAVRCGATTGQQCLSFRFMDGNSYLMTDSTLAPGHRGSVQPQREEVITVIARNTQRGQMLEISRGDLIKLVQDERLHLPSGCYDAVTAVSQAAKINRVVAMIVGLEQGRCGRIGFVLVAASG